MKELDGGVTLDGEGEEGITWNILGQSYLAKAICDTTFAFEANSAPGDFVPVDIQANREELILVQEGGLYLKLDGKWTKAKAGDLVRMPMGVPHGYFNKSDEPVKALFWVSPAGKLKELFDNLHELTDVERVVQLSAEHDVNFLPPEASD